jgi:hypothetical protein
MVHGILGIRRPQTKRTARIPTVAWTISPADRVTVNFRLKRAAVFESQAGERREFRRSPMRPAAVFRSQAADRREVHRSPMHPAAVFRSQASDRHEVHRSRMRPAAVFRSQASDRCEFHRPGVRPDPSPGCCKRRHRAAVGPVRARAPRSRPRDRGRSFDAACSRPAGSPRARRSAAPPPAPSWSRA